MVLNMSWVHTPRLLRCERSAIVIIALISVSSTVLAQQSKAVGSVLSEIEKSALKARATGVVTKHLRSSYLLANYHAQLLQWQAALKGDDANPISRYTLADTDSLWDARLTFREAVSQEYLNRIQAVDKNELAKWTSTLEGTAGSFAVSLSVDLMPLTAIFATSYVRETGKPWGWAALQDYLQSRGHLGQFDSNTTRALLLVIQTERLFRHGTGFNGDESVKLRARLGHIPREAIFGWQLAGAFTTSGDSAMSLAISDELFRRDLFLMERYLQKQTAAKAVVATALIPYLDNGNNDFRKAAVAMLGMMKATEAVEPLVRSLKDNGVGFQVFESLGLIADPRAIASVVSLAKEKGKAVGNELNTLELMAAIGDTQAIEAIGGLFKGDDRHVRDAVIQLLQRHYYSATAPDGKKWVIRDPRVEEWRNWREPTKQ